ncbi:DUF2029 domain-containing protein [Candidatus Woesearchaeota archaeon]|nr:DUF2029 domain-containing protein [Candidatus Woesearchaeota archaeon]
MGTPNKTYIQTYYLIVISVIILSIAMVIIAFPTSGWDFVIDCHAVEVVKDGGNPYQYDQLLEKSHMEGMFFWYPPISLLLYEKACQGFRLNYHIIWSLLLIATFIVIASARKKNSRSLLMVLLISGFLGSYWNFRTGNIGIFQLLFYAIAIYFLLYKRPFLSGIVLTLMCYPKLIHFILAPIFLFFQKRKKIYFVIGLLFSFIILSLTSMILFPKMTADYFPNMISGPQLEDVDHLALVDHFIPLSMGGGKHNPSLVLLLFSIFNGHQYLSLLVYFLIIVIIGLIYLKYHKHRTKYSDNLMFALVSVFLVYPRLKPYTFILVVIPVYFLINDFKLKHIINMILITCYFPIFLFAAGYAFNMYGDFLWVDYGQYLSLVLFYIYYLHLFFNQYSTSRHKMR